MRCRVGVCHRDTKTLSVPTAHTHTPYRWEFVPGALKCLHSDVSAAKNYLILPRNLCILNVRRDSFHVAVLAAFTLFTELAMVQISTATTDARNYAQDGVIYLATTNQFDLLCKFMHM